MLKILRSHDFRHTAINQLWRLFSGPLLLLLIPIYLSAQTQGYWYTFTSLAALAVFADMGFSTILLQFSAHEYAHLKFDSNKTLLGSEEHLGRLASLFRFAIKWSSMMGLLAFPIIAIIGYFILAQKEINVSWLYPWLLYLFASVFVFVNSMLMSFFEGLNSVGEIQKIRFYISVLTVSSTAVLLILHFDLYALALSLALSAVIGNSIIVFKYFHTIKQLYNISKIYIHDWKQEILKLIGKYAISWIGGYFIFYIFTPIAFHYYGAIESGKVGLSIALFMAIFGIANIWMTIITPKINMLVSQRDYKTLNNLFQKHLILSMLTYLFGVFLLFAILSLFKENLPFEKRLVGSIALYTLAACWFMQIIINSLAIYMRAHKEEPLVILSFLSGIYISSATLLIAYYQLPFQYYFLGFLSSYIWGFPWVWKIFKQYKKD